MKLNRSLPDRAGGGRRAALATMVGSALGACTASVPTASLPDLAVLEEQVRSTELAFADTMARRDFEGFLRFLASDAIFIDRGRPLRGPAAIAGRWRGFYSAPQAPFAWRPDLVQVLDGGTLALSTGPVWQPEGTIIARFQSIWRRDADRWYIILDSGSPVCQRDP